MLTETELDHVLNWQPYRADWKVDRNANDAFTNSYINELTAAFNKNRHFKLSVTNNGDMSNYLEFICYPAFKETYSGMAVMVLISLCAPLATYGQTVFYIDNQSRSYTTLGVDGIAVITSPGLFTIEAEVKRILNIYGITLFDKQYLSKPLPAEKAEGMENLRGNRYLHGIFQVMD